MICPECNKKVRPRGKFVHQGPDGKVRHSGCLPKRTCRHCKGVVTLSLSSAIPDGTGGWVHRGCRKRRKDRPETWKNPAIIKWTPGARPPDEEIEDRIAHYQDQLSTLNTIQENYSGTSSTGASVHRKDEGKASRKGRPEPEALTPESARRFFAAVIEEAVLDAVREATIQRKKPSRQTRQAFHGPEES